MLISSNEKVNYKIYTYLKINDSYSHKVLQCIDLYSKQGYEFQDGLVDSGDAVMRYRNNADINYADFQIDKKVYIGTAGHFSSDYILTKNSAPNLCDFSDEFDNINEA